MDIKLKHFQKYPNSGDIFSLEVARRYISSDITSCDESPLTEPNLVLLGSILNWSDAMSHVCGTGIIAPMIKMHSIPKHISCVRGPLTARYLLEQGIKTTDRFGDPGVLAAEIYPDDNSIDYEIGILPHYADSRSPWLEQCRQAGALIIDPLSPLDEYFSNLGRCRVILSSSLHGIIFAHAYSKPALWIELSNQVIGDGFKFFDYYASIGTMPDKVNRIRVPHNANPEELAKLATSADQSDLRETLKEALVETKTQLEKAH